MVRSMVVVARLGDKRARALEAARAGLGLPALRWVDWGDALDDPGALATLGSAGDWLRVESPGADPALWHRLAALGGGEHRVADGEWRPGDRKSTRLNSSHRCTSRMPSSA